MCDFLEYTKDEEFAKNTRIPIANGKLTDLKAPPESRRKDMLIGAE